MRQLISKTLDAILANTRHPILPSMSVHMAVRQFLEVSYSCGDHKRRGYRSAFLQLLRTIAKKIREDPSNAAIFFDIFPKQENRVRLNPKGGDTVQSRILKTLHSAAGTHVYLSPALVFCTFVIVSV